MILNRKELVEAGFCGDLQALYDHARIERFRTADPAGEALAAIGVQAGNELEVGGYRRLAEWDVRVTEALFKTVRTTVARSLLDHDPEAGDDVLAIDWVQDALQGGPLARLNRDQQAWKILRLVLVDARRALDFQQRGFFVGRGDHEAALAVHYVWQQALTRKAFPARSVEEMHVQGREFLKNARAREPDNPLLELLEQRVRLSWDVLDGAARQNALVRVLDLASRPATDLAQAGAGVALAAQTTLADAGLRFRDPALARSALTSIEAAVGTEPLRLTLQKAWGEALGGDPVAARQLAASVASRGDDQLRAKASQVMRTIGDDAAADALMTQVAGQFRPRKNPLAPPGLRMP